MVSLKNEEKKPNHISPLELNQWLITIVHWWLTVRLKEEKTEMPHNLKRKLTTEQTISVITPGGHSLVICNYEAWTVEEINLSLVFLVVQWVSRSRNLSTPSSRVFSAKCWYSRTIYENMAKERLAFSSPPCAASKMPELFSFPFDCAASPRK